MENPFETLEERLTRIEQDQQRILSLLEGREIVEWCSLKTAQERTDVAVRTWEELIAKREIGRSKPGRSVRVMVDEINWYMMKHYIPGRHGIFLKSKAA